MAVAHGQERGASFTLENDIFGGQDRHYTHGLKLSLFDSSPTVFNASGWRLTVGQELYTPEDVEARDVVATDRPFAGWAYIELSLRWRDGEVWDEASLAAGVVGPLAQGELTHTWAHRATGSTKAKGWRNQLRDEPGFVLRYQRTFLLLRGGGAFSYDVRPTAGVAVGNVATHAALGTGFRLGWGLPWGESNPQFSFYLEAHVEVRLVAYNVFLDGNALRSGGHSVMKEALVGRALLGVTLAISDTFSLSYTHTFVTPEFSGQDGGDYFGSLSLTLYW